MYFDKMIRMYGLIKNRKKPSIYKWVNDSIVIFSVLYVDDILLIGNNVPLLQEGVVIR